MIVFAVCLGIGFGLSAFIAMWNMKLYNHLQLTDNSPRGALPFLNSNPVAVRGAISELTQSIWESPSEWIRANENKIAHRQSKIAVWIGDGKDGLRIIGSISMNDLLDEEKEMLWDACKFFESNLIGELLTSKPKPTRNQEVSLFKKGEHIGRQYQFDKKGAIVPVERKR